MDICFLLHFVVTFGDKVFREVDGAAAGQVYVGVEPGGGDDVQAGGAAGPVRQALRYRHLARPAQSAQRIIVNRGQCLGM